MRQVDIRIYKGVEASARLEDQWTRLWQVSPLRSVYNHPRWFYCQRDVGRESLILAALEGDTLLALIPFIEKPWRWPIHLGPLRLSSVPLRYAALSGGVALAPSKNFSLVEQMLSYLFREENHDVYYLENLNSNSFIAHAIKDSPTLLATHTVHSVTPPTPHWLISLPKSYDAYKASLTSKFRGELKRKLKSLEQACDKGLRLEIFTPESDLARFAELMSVVVRNSWQAGSLSRTVGENDRVLLRAFAREGWLRGYVLSNGDTPIAAEIDNILGQHMFAESAAYHRDWAPHQPGKALQMKIIEDACSLGLASIDLGTGDHAYKRAFADQHYEEHNVYAVARKPMLTALRNADTLVQFATVLGRRFAEETGSTTAIRQALRRLR